MDKIIPRWEWRTFGESFLVKPTLNMLPWLRVTFRRPTSCTFCPTPTMKVRFDLMDIKTLEQVNADGLEQWKPVMKASFPLASAEVKKVLAALGVQLQSLARENYTLDQFVSELAEPGGLRAVKVHKKRMRYKVNGCTSEVTDVVADGQKTRTVALELEDAARVIATVRDMGLSQFPNIRYPRGLKQLVGMRG